MLHWLRKYFGFNRSELNGITVLLILIVVIWLIPPLYSSIYKPSPIAYERLSEAVKILEANEGQTENAPVEISYFKFDPNGLAVSAWEKLGLRSAQIKNIKNYEAKGGKFYKKEDLKKLYTISAEDYERLAPFIVIVNRERGEGDHSGERKPLESNRLSGKALPKISSAPKVIELGTADSTVLTELPGIGPVFASRIVRYRKLLGGFYAMQQLLEVYGMDSTKYELIRPHLQLNSKDVVKIALNRASIEELGKHPYIRYTYAKLIVRYREQHGDFKQLNDLLGIKLIDELYLRKIAPYLTTDK